MNINKFKLLYFHHNYTTYSNIKYLDYNFNILYLIKSSLTCVVMVTCLKLYFY